MVKQRKAVAAAVTKPEFTGTLRKLRRRNRLLVRVQALRMLQQEQQQQQQQQGQESQPGPDGSAFAKGAGDAGLDGGAVTPSGCVNGEETKEFLSTGRTGRRNAMPHVFGRNAELGTADLPEKFEALTTDTDAGPSCSGSHGDPGASSASQSG